MKTPVCDFLREYGESGMVRMHMPGHKGKPETGCDACDLTEIEGADELYRSRGILRESEENAASLFGTGRTVYSAEGSSLCIRAMLYLASLRAAEEKLPRRILAGRNAHKTLMTAAALLDIEIDWVYPEPEEGLLSCGITAEKISESLNKKAYMAVYVTTPDYLGHTVPVQGIAEACRRKGVPLLADNAHGAYLRFLAEDRHPVSEGADLCCDSAHKTLPCLTGAAYLHISKRAPESFARNAERAMSLFASTSRPAGSPGKAGMENDGRRGDEADPVSENVRIYRNGTGRAPADGRDRMRIRRSGPYGADAFCGDRRRGVGTRPDGAGKDSAPGSASGRLAADESPGEGPGHPAGYAFPYGCNPRGTGGREDHGGSVHRLSPGGAGGGCRGKNRGGRRTGFPVLRHPGMRGRPGRIKPEDCIPKKSVVPLANQQLFCYNP